MDLENHHDEDNNSEGEHDSDVEARLYAEIYFDDSKIDPASVPQDTANGSGKSDLILENLSITINPESNQRVVLDSNKAISDSNIQQPAQKKQSIESHLEDATKKNDSAAPVKTSVFQRLSQGSVFQRLSKNDVFQRLSNKKEIQLKETQSVTTSSEIEESKYSAGSKKKETHMHNFESYKLSSDSEESICEVPVSPRPPPITINVGDSGNDSDSSSEETQIQSSREIEEIILDSSESEDVETIEENIIINCNEAERTSYDINELQDIVHNEQNGNINLDKSRVQNKNSNSKIVCAETSNVDNSDKVSCSIKDSRNMTLEEYSFQPMTEKMKLFYNNSWGGENFDHQKIRKKMSKNPNMWKILDEDRRFKTSRRYFGVKCSRCNRDGHKVFQCPEPQKLPCCYMCGKRGHYENRCPDKKCLTCGRKQITFRKICNGCRDLQCKRCQAPGHTSSACPDLWRQYHQTTTVNGAFPTHFSSVMKPYYTLSCCNCAESGHESTSCNKLRWSQHFQNPIYVSSYELSKVEEDNSNHHPNSKPKSNGVHLQEENANEICELRDFVVEDVSQDVLFCFESKKMSNSARNKLQRLTKKDILRNLVPQRDVSTCLITKNFQIFLESAAQDILARFELRKDDTIVCLNLSAELHFRELLQKILEQYFQCPNKEKKYLYYKYDRSSEHVRLLFTLMKRELNQIYETPLELNQKIVNFKLTDNEDNIEELLNYHKKLLLSLFKSGCLEIFGSKKVFKSVRKFLKVENTKELCPILYFNLIYIFNRVFVKQFVRDLPNVVESLIFKNITKYCSGKSSRARPGELNITNDNLNDSCSANINSVENLTIMSQSNNIPLMELNSVQNGNIAAYPPLNLVNNIDDQLNHNTKISQDTQNNSDLRNSLKQKRIKNKAINLEKSKIVKKLSAEDKILKQLNDVTGHEKRVREILRDAKSVNCPELKRQMASLYSRLHKKKRITGHEIFYFLVNVKLKQLELNKSNSER